MMIRFYKFNVDFVEANHHSPDLHRRVFYIYIHRN